MIGVGFPDQGFWVCVIVFADKAVDGGLKVDDGLEDATLEPAPREFGEEALDGIEPRARGRREVEGPAWMAGEPGADLVLLVRSVVVEDDVDGLVRRHLALDAVEEADDTLVHEPLLPAPHAGLGLAGLAHDRRSAEPLVGLQDDPRPPDMFLRALRVRDDRLQSLTVARRDSKMDAGTHRTDSHDTAQYGIPKRTLSFRSIH